MSAFAKGEHSAFTKYDKIGKEDGSSSLKRKKTLSPDSEVRTIMQKRTTTPRVDIINRGSSTRLLEVLEGTSAEGEDEEVKKLDKQQNKDISRMRHRSASVYAKRARELQEKIEEIDLLLSEEKDKNKINVLEQKKEELQLAKKAKEAAASFSYRGTLRKRRHSVGGKTKKKLRNKRKSLFLKKRTKRKTRRGYGGKSSKRRWSRKYKLSINCKNPKGFSQKQYCKGRLKRKTKRKLKKRRRTKKRRRR